MSEQLVWQIIKNNNAFLVKRDGAVFSSEKFNVAKKNSFKFSGLARNAAVDVSLVQPTKEKKSAYVALNLKTAKRSGNKPGSAYSGSQRLSFKRASGAATVEKQTALRKDLAKVARRRYEILARSVKAARQE